MFDPHTDEASASFEFEFDPGPYVPSDDFRAAVRRRGRQLRRRRRLASSGAALTLCVVLAAAGLATAVDRRLDDVDRAPLEMTGAPATDDRPFNVLLVGVDALDGRPTSLNTDTLVIVRTDPVAGTAALLSLPRDLVLEGPSWPAERINSVYAREGMQGLLTRIHETLGLEINHTITIDGAGLVGLVDAIGGIGIDVPAVVRDRQAGLSLARPGCQTLDGATALALARSRHLQILDANGQWREDPTADLGRTARQRALLIAAVASLVQTDPGPDELWDLAGVLAAHAVVDESLTNGRLVDLARFGLGLDPAAIVERVLPVVGQTLDSGAQVLVPDGSADDVLAQFGGALHADVEVAEGPGLGAGGLAAEPTIEMTRCDRP